MPDTAKATGKTGIDARIYEAAIRALTPEKKAELQAAINDVLAIGAQAALRERARKAAEQQEKGEAA